LALPPSSDGFGSTSVRFEWSAFRRSYTTTLSTETLTARAGNRRFRLLSPLHAHTKAPYKMDYHGKTLMKAKDA
jgi:hypothetical protein